jgi:hypothetical protein
MRMPAVGSTGSRNCKPCLISSAALPRDQCGYRASSPLTSPNSLLIVLLSQHEQSQVK